MSFFRDSNSFETDTQVLLVTVGDFTSLRIFIKAAQTFSLVPIVFYSYSFAQSTRWTDFHPSGPRILEYLQEVCEKFQITDKIQLNTEVTDVKWLEDEHLWQVTLSHLVANMGDLSSKDRRKHIAEHGVQSVYHRQETARCKILVSGMGGLVEPHSWPDHIPGSENFQGSIFHAARWNNNVDLNDKDVIVIGTGCSAAQCGFDLQFHAA